MNSPIRRVFESKTAHNGNIERPHVEVATFAPVTRTVRLIRDSRCLAGRKSVLNNIQVLRAVAAMAVVAHHALAELHLRFGAPSLGFLDSVGRAGVDLFFVISGFIMFHATHDTPQTPLRFWTNRVVRIAPLYWLVTLLVAALWLAGLAPFGVAKIDGQDILASLAFIPDVRADGSAYPVLAVGWTLVYEMYFYVLFGLCLLLRSQGLSLAVLTGFFLASWLALTQMTAPSHMLGVYLQPITLEFAAGGALALIWRRLPATLPAGAGRFWGYGLIIGGALALAVAAGYFGEAINTDGALRLAVFGSPAILVVAGALVLERAGAVSHQPHLLLLGAASYAIYLIHPLGVQYGTAAVAGAGSIVAGVFAALVSVALGIALHLRIEKPLLARLSGAARMRASAAA
jgi:exopolysaccharide production protein ExoZ